jgi:hypothetical protein
MAEETMVVKKSLLRKLLDKATPEGGLKKAGGDELAPSNYKDRGVSALLTGLVIAFLNRTDAVAKNDTLKKHWYALPIAAGVIGYWLHRKGNKYGFLLMALAAFQGLNNFYDRPKTEEEKKKEAETKGFGDGSFLLPQGMLRVMTPGGHEVHIPAAQAHLYGIGGTTGDPADIITESIYSRVAA